VLKRCKELEEDGHRWVAERDELIAKFKSERSLYIAEYNGKLKESLRILKMQLSEAQADSSSK
jgi:hypothetical protein